MPDPAIKVEGLSKRYRIGQYVGGGRYQYRALRDVITNAVSSPFRRLRSAFSGSQLGTPDSGLSPDNYIWALKDVSFKVKQGEVMGIIGRNGAGKTTLLKVLSRITEPTEGWAKIKGRVGSLLEIGTGFHPELTGRENIYLSGAILGMTKTEMNRKFDEIVAFAGLKRFIDTPVKRYSSGMWVRLGFAVAVHLEPEILLVDEVLAVGDVAFQKKCLGKMGDVAKEGRTVLFVSHNIGSIQRLCDSCLLLDGGRVLSIGETERIIEKYITAGMSNRAEFVQEPDPSKGMRLRRMRLISEDGECRSEFACTDSFRVLSEYDVNRPVSGCQVALSFTRSDGVIAFATADYDTNPSLLDVRHVGRYHAEVSIPARWLNAGRYTITAYLSSQTTSHDVVEAVTFSIIETDSPGSFFGIGWRKGVFQPVMEWKTDRLEN